MGEVCLRTSYGGDTKAMITVDSIERNIQVAAKTHDSGKFYTTLLDIHAFGSRFEQRGTTLKLFGELRRALVSEFSPNFKKNKKPRNDVSSGGREPADLAYAEWYSHEWELRKTAETLDELVKLYCNDAYSSTDADLELLQADLKSLREYPEIAGALANAHPARGAK